LSFEFAQNICFQIRVSRYITALNRTSKLNVIIVWICSSVFNFERLDILPDSIEHPSKTLLWFEFAQSLRFQLLASRYITGFIWTSELKVSAVCICYELLISIMTVSINYRTQSDIRVKSYCHLNLLRASVLNFECLDILRDSIIHPSKKLLSFEFAQSFYFQFQASRYITGFNRTSE